MNSHFMLFGKFTKVVWKVIWINDKLKKIVLCFIHVVLFSVKIQYIMPDIPLKFNF